MDKKIKYIVDHIVQGEADAHLPEQLDMIRLEGESYSIIEDSASYSIRLLHSDLNNKTYEISVNGELFRVVLKNELDVLIEELGFEMKEQTAESRLLSPMPGLVLNVFAEAGQEVKAGDKLLILEAMKMENVIKARHDAIVRTVHVKPGDAVDKNTLLIEMQNSQDQSIKYR